MSDETLQCIAAVAFIPQICRDGACNPNKIAIGTRFTIDVCAENRAVLPFAGLDSNGQGLSAHIVESSLIESARIQVSIPRGSSLASGAGVIQLQEFVPSPEASSATFLLEVNGCIDTFACGQILLNRAVPLSVAGGSTCLGTITGIVVDDPQSNGFFRVDAASQPADLMVTDARCTPGIYGGGQGSTVGVVIHPPPPMPPLPSVPPPPPLPPPPPSSPPPSSPDPPNPPPERWQLRDGTQTQHVEKGAPQLSPLANVCLALQLATRYLLLLIAGRRI